MRPSDVPLANRIKATLLDYHNNERTLLGIATPARIDALVEQMVESVRRIKYVFKIRDQNRPIDPDRANPNSAIFDPLIGAVHHRRQGNLDEAFWLVFLSTHFGKNLYTDWGLTKGFYGALGTTPIWSWQRAISDTNGLIDWLDANKDALSETGNFGNHRKYESLNARTFNGTGAAITSYLNWIGPSHNTFIANAQAQAGNPKALFEYLYNSMDSVARFGRTGKFDYLTMVGKIGLANLTPGKAYAKGATGPLRGGRLLYGGATDSPITERDLEDLLVTLGSKFDYLDFEMQVLEDSLCNWQKSPDLFVAFRG